MSSLIHRYFPASTVAGGSLRATYRIATSRLLRADGQEQHQVVVVLDEEARLLTVEALTSETASTIWHRGILQEKSNGVVEIVE